MSLPIGVPGRILALGLLLLCVALLWVGAAGPALSLYQDRQAQLDQNVRILDRLRHLAGELSQLRAQEITGPSVPSEFLSGISDALAAANLQNILQDLAAKSAVNLSRIESLPTEASGANSRISVRIDFRGNHAQLVALLSAVEQTSPMLVVTEATLHGADLPIPDAPDVLDCTFTVAGFRHGEETGP